MKTLRESFTGGAVGGGGGDGGGGVGGGEGGGEGGGVGGGVGVPVAGLFPTTATLRLVLPVRPAASRTPAVNV
jgi:hypothetical protein